MLSIFVIIALLVVQVYSFGATIGLRRASRAGSLSMMSTGGKLDMLGLIPLCLEASSTTTTSNDPTAGMSPDEITNYISNVGGGMCGYPEAVRTGVGLGEPGIVFGVLTVGYLVLGLWNLR